jgi:(E)-2-((N-methylformamido)methylene)succinate hydrolase
MIHAEHHGVDGTTPVVLLHGVGLDHRMWDRCLPALGSCDVLVPDLRGHGQSPPARPGTTLADLVDDVAKVMTGSAHVVGFSLGALVAQRLAASHARRVRSLTLVSSVAERSPAERAAVRRRLKLASSDLPASAEAAVDRWFSPAWRQREPRLLQQVRDRMLANDPDSYAACYRVFTEADAEVAPLQRLITAPTLVLTGEGDPGSTPAMARRLGAAIPGTRSVVVVPGARHLLPLERPEAVTSPLLTLISELEHHEHTQHV